MYDNKLLPKFKKGILVFNIISLMPNDFNRKISDLINSGGSVLKTLFGTLDKQYLELIKNKFKKLGWVSQELYHS